MPKTQVWFDRNRKFHLTLYDFAVREQKKNKRNKKSLQKKNKIKESHSSIQSNFVLRLLQPPAATDIITLQITANNSLSSGDTDKQFVYVCVGTKFSFIIVLTIDIVSKMYGESLTGRYAITHSFSQIKLL